MCTYIPRLQCAISASDLSRPKLLCEVLLKHKRLHGHPYTQCVSGGPAGKHSSRSMHSHKLTSGPVMAFITPFAPLSADCYGS